MPETTQSDLPDGCPTCGALPCDWAAGGADAAKTVEALLADREKIEGQMDGGDFDQWPTSTFYGQLRMQARDSLDPEYARFMAATATHLGILSGRYDAQREIADRAKEDAARLRAQCEALDSFHTPRTLDQWSDDDGDVLWHLMPICQPPWVGTPQDTDWPFADEDDARLWWTRLPDCNEIHKRWKENAS